MNFLRAIARTKIPDRIRQTPESYRERINQIAAQEERASNAPLHEGREEEVFKYFEVCFVLLSTDPPRFYFRGPFIVKVTANHVPQEKPIFFITCSVKLYAWPVAKDMVVIRTGERSLAFALPNICYGLDFHQDCNQDTINDVQRLFELNSQFIDLADEGDVYPFFESDPCFWSKVAPFVHALAGSKFAEIGQHYTYDPSVSCKNAFYYVTTITRLLRKAVLSGRLMRKGLKYLDGRPSPEEDEERPVPVDTYPSITAITDIVEAMENKEPLRMLKMGTTSSTYSALWHWWKEDKSRQINIEKLGVRLWKTTVWFMGECSNFLLRERKGRMTYYESRVQARK